MPLYSHIREVLRARILDGTYKATPMLDEMTLTRIPNFNSEVPNCLKNQTYSSSMSIT